MEDLLSLWSYQERKLLYTTLELESVKMEVDEEVKKNKENVKNLLHLVYQQRDDARGEIQKLMNKLGSTSPVNSFFDVASCPVFSNSNGGFRQPGSPAARGYRKSRSLFGSDRHVCDGKDAASEGKTHESCSRCGSSTSDDAAHRKTSAVADSSAEPTLLNLFGGFETSEIHLPRILNSLVGNLRLCFHVELQQ